MNKSAILFLAAALVMSTGCKVGPDWSKPNMAMPAAFRGGCIGSGSMADTPWQSVISDSNLKSLLNDVFSNNRSLEAMQRNVNAARQYVTIARAPIFPWFGYGAHSSKGMNSSVGSKVQREGQSGAEASQAPGASPTLPQIGTGSDILMRIDRVGREMTMGQGMCGSRSGSVPTNVGQPTIRVTSLTVGGK